MNQSIDRKFKISATSIGSGNKYSDENAVLFLAKDIAFARALPEYLNQCIICGAGQDQITAVELLIDRVNAFQLENVGVAKIPDVDPKTEPGCLQK